MIKFSFSVNKSSMLPRLVGKLIMILVGFVMYSVRLKEITVTERMKHLSVGSYGVPALEGVEKRNVIRTL